MQSSNLGPDPANKKIVLELWGSQWSQRKNVFALRFSVGFTVNDERQRAVQNFTIHSQLLEALSIRRHLIRAPDHVEWPLPRDQNTETVIIIHDLLFSWLKEQEMLHAEK